MDFRRGISSTSSFPKDSSVMSLKRVGLGNAQEIMNKISKTNFNGKGDYAKVHSDFNKCYSDAQATQYLLTRGTLKNEMQKFMQDLPAFQNKKGLLANDIASKLNNAISKYNTNLKEAKRLFVFGKAIGAIQKFNNTKYVKSRTYKQEKNDAGKWVYVKDANGNKVVSSESYYSITQSSDVYSMASTMRGYNGGRDVDNKVMSFPDFNFGWISQINE